MTERCSNCQFGFIHPADPDTTYCRFDPPEFVPPSGSQIKPVRADGWCGKWQFRTYATKSVPAPVSDPNPERSSNLSVRGKRKSGIASII